MLREVVIIDEERCDGCGLCVPACEEGALKVVDGKARLISDRLCDGLGACLGHCPQDAIRIEQREAEAFDESLLAARAQEANAADLPAEKPISRSPMRVNHAGGCLGIRFAQFSQAFTGAACQGASDKPIGAGQPSALRHWPVQLRLLQPSALVLRGARLLVAADCVPVALPDFHSQLLRDRAVVIACPKLDDTRGYVEKLAEMIRNNDLAEITVAHMEVPCCTGILQAVLEARRLAGSDLPINDVVIGVQGQIISRQEITAETTALSSL
jgi:NAD-dependent dihydropyrimidine dehydrogenase PreA subunit